MTLYEKRAPRIGHFIFLLAAVGLTGFMTYFVFLRETGGGSLDAEQPIDAGGKVIFGFLILIGVFMTGVFAYRLIKNPAYFVITEEGFEYSPGGVSTGLIRWSDIFEFKEETVLRVGGAGIGPGVHEATLAVVLRNPEEYVAKFPAALKPLFALRAEMNSSVLLLNPRDLGSDYPAILTIMREQVQQHGGRKA